MALRRQTIASAAAVLIVTTLLSNILGILKEILVAKAYGATPGYDAFVLAQYVPSLVYSSLFFGMPNVFTPIYHDVRESLGHERSEAFQRSFLLFWIVACVLLTSAVMALIGVLDSRLERRPKPRPGPR